MPLPKHPNTDQTINSIIELMVPKIHYGFYELWQQSYKAVLIEWFINEQQSMECFNRMIYNDLILPMDKNYPSIGLPLTQQFVMLSEKGIKIREDGGWLKYLEQSKIKTPFIDGYTVKWIVFILVVLSAIPIISGLLKGDNNESTESPKTKVPSEQRQPDQIPSIQDSNYLSPKSDSIKLDSVTKSKKP